MGEQQLLDFDTEVKEENEQSVKENKKTEDVEKKESVSEDDKGEQKATTESESAGKDSGKSKAKSKSSGGSTKQSGNKKSDKGKSSEVTLDRDLNTWSSNIIGTPPKKATPNAYFEGIVAYEGLNPDEAHYAPFKQINHMQRQIYVDDITIENPQILETKYRISGSFYYVVSHITEEQFNEALQHPDMKHVTIDYSWVSCHKDTKRNYIVTHDQQPSLKEIKSIDKELDKYKKENSDKE